MMKIPNSGPRALAAVTLLAMLGVIGWLALHRPPLSRPAATAETNQIGRPGHTEPAARNRRPAASPAKTPAVAERRNMPNAERLQLLEENGELFTDSDIREYQLAQKASWWGKPLDPTSFWAGRVVWLDSDSRLAANRHGRAWPPMPYTDQRLANFPNDDKVDRSWATPEGPDIHYGQSSAEGAFWALFEKTHPRPPDDLERRQAELAGRVFLSARRGNPGPLDQAAIQPSVAAVVPFIQNAVQAGYPQEAFSSDALFWAYVIAQRRSYSKLIGRGHAPNSPLARSALEDIPVQQQYIAEPLPEDQLRAANAWKITYLNRLRRERTDEPYINAYLQAWNLSADEVFSETNR